MVALCPTCGAVTPVAEVTDNLTNSELKVYNYIAKHPGCKVIDLITAIYGSRDDGGPECASSAIHVFINRINHKLIDHKIFSTFHGQGATYNIAEVPPNASL